MVTVHESAKLFKFSTDLEPVRKTAYSSLKFVIFQQKDWISLWNERDEWTCFHHRNAHKNEWNELLKYSEPKSNTTILISWKRRIGIIVCRQWKQTMEEQTMEADNGRADDGRADNGKRKVGISVCNGSDNGSKQSLTQLTQKEPTSVSQMITKKSLPKDHREKSPKGSPRKVSQMITKKSFPNDHREKFLTGPSTTVFWSRKGAKSAYESLQKKMIEMKMWHGWDWKFKTIFWINWKHKDQKLWLRWRECECRYRSLESWHKKAKVVRWKINRKSGDYSLKIQNEIMRTSLWKFGNEMWWTSLLQVESKMRPKLVFKAIKWRDSTAAS